MCRTHYKFLAQLIAKAEQVCVVSRSYSVFYVQEIVELCICTKLLICVTRLYVLSDKVVKMLANKMNDD